MKCKLCGKKIIRQSGSHKYCKVCSEALKQKRLTERMRIEELKRKERYKELKEEMYKIKHKRGDYISFLGLKLILLGDDYEINNLLQNNLENRKTFIVITPAQKGYLQRSYKYFYSVNELLNILYNKLDNLYVRDRYKKKYKKWIKRLENIKDRDLTLKECEELNQKQLEELK